MSSPITSQATTRTRLANTGAWQPGDPVGHRRLAEVFTEQSPLQLVSGELFAPVTVAYEAWGALNADASNAILVLPPLTMGTDAASHPDDPTSSPGWWEYLIGPGRALDTDRFFVVCPNTFGSCQGTTGPASLDPSGRPWGSRFPRIDVIDQVTVEAALADALGIRRWVSVIGMSIGGARALEWAVSRPDRMGSVVLIASTAATRLQQWGLLTLQIELIREHPGFHGGDYYELPEGNGPRASIAMARAFGHLGYATERYFQDRFAETAWDADPEQARTEFEGYLFAQGQKVAERFDANSYAVLCDAARTHNVGRGRSGISAALKRVTCPAHVVGFDTDTAMPLEAQRELVTTIPKAELTVVETTNGHYSVFYEQQRLDPVLRRAARDAESGE
ncbi:homoserine O-acetyltransferase [Longimycelium tulufanense]|uniref:Probable acyltransferase n=1 Tax=Longimycelium tulufanense TaxID=907463 RepID=A0A8J3CAS0_9PSEU|nr:homoserine O-acetyltransferase [Longimycelium tulufanense]GGM41338.1 homoserine O-acetyltransferase [Longimycelium tulufanense]